MTCAVSAACFDTGNRSKRSNWAGSIKECLESYGFQDVWAQGGVSNEAAGAV